MTNYETKNELGHTWVRTGHTMQALELLDGDLHDMQDYADDMNAAVLDSAGLQIVMQSNGWAVVPAGRNVRAVALAIDLAADALGTPDTVEALPENVTKLQRLVAEQYSLVTTTYDAATDRLVIGEKGEPTVGLLRASTATVDDLRVAIRRYLSA